MSRVVPLLLALLLAACADPGQGLADAAAAPATDAASQGAPASTEDIVRYDCRSDADCAVKDVGNCCGYYPACVNRDSPTFPERVRAACEAEGIAGVCGFPVIQGCRCVESRCEAVDTASGGLPLN